MKSFFTLTLCFLTLSLTAQEAGCTDSLANNFNPEATEDDGTCCYLTIAQNDTTICEGDSLSLGINGLSPVNWTEIYLEDFEDGEAQGWTINDGAAGGQSVYNLNGNMVWGMTSDWNNFRRVIPGYPNSDGLAIEYKAKKEAGGWSVKYRSNTVTFNDNSQDGYMFGYSASNGTYNVLNSVLRSSYPQFNINDWHTYRIEEIGTDC